MWNALPLYARFIIGDARDVLEDLPPKSVDLVVTSPPFCGLRTYTDDDREIGKEPPSEYLTALFDVIALCRRALAPHGSLVIELGDTYSGSGGAGGDYQPGGWHEGDPVYRQAREGQWPPPKSLCAVPSAVEVGLAYGVHPLTGEPHAAGTWLVRNGAAWVKPNPRPGEEADKFRPSWSLVICAALNPNRYWNEAAARRDAVTSKARSGGWHSPRKDGAAVPDVFTIAPGGRKAKGHQAPWPESLVFRMIETQAAMVVCMECGLPARYVIAEDAWTDCRHNAWRRGVVLDPFAGSGTTIAVANGCGRDAIGIDLDGTNATRLAQRVGGLFLTVETHLKSVPTNDEYL